MKILPLAYLGSQEWWREVLSPDAVVDVGEHYVKQTCRNRTEIACPELFIHDSTTSSGPVCPFAAFSPVPLWGNDFGIVV